MTRRCFPWLAGSVGLAGASQSREALPWPGLNQMGKKWLSMHVICRVGELGELTLRRGTACPQLQGAKGQSGDAGARSRLKTPPCLPQGGGPGCGHLQATASLPALVSHKRVTKSHPVLWWPWTNPEVSLASRG